MTSDTIPKESCWYCPGDKAVDDHPLADAWALCGTCYTNPKARKATEDMNRTRKFYIDTKVAAFAWRDWDRSNLGDWNREVTEAMP